MIRAQNLFKSFGGVHALRGVGLDIADGEIHALCGENGAGKSTLIKILSGSITPDDGQVLIDDAPLELGAVHASEMAGIAVIHQESVAFPHLSAPDNIFVGREPRRLGGLLLDRASMRSQTRDLLARLGESIDLSVPVGDLPVAQRQMVGMARALARKCRLLIMDEPTASLSARESKALFRIVRQLRSEGVSILYVSHRLEEIFDLADRVSVLRDGQYVATRPVCEIDRSGLIKLMVGRELLSGPLSPRERVRVRADGAETPALELRWVSRLPAFQDISVSLHSGQILGLSGLVGAGRSELAQAIFGIDSYDAGQVLIDGQPLPPNSVLAAQSAGIALVPEDRQHLGLVLPMSVGQNLSMAMLPRLQRLGMIDFAAEKTLVRDMMQSLLVKAASPGLPASSLSGGNQQKVLLGKWLATRPKILILDEPTRGVDVGAKAEIYKLIRQLAADGLAVLLISSDMPELLLLADRIMVMRQGRLSGEFSAAGATQEKLLAAALPDAEAAA